MGWITQADFDAMMTPTEQTTEDEDQELDQGENLATDGAL
jgi:hypothetical protein